MTVILPLDFFDFTAHYQSFLLITISWLIEQTFSLVVLAINILGNLIAVVLYQAIGRLHNTLRTTIVLLQFKEFGTLKFFLKTKYIVDVSTSETIDTLRVISYCAHTSLLLAKLHHDTHLYMVGVLILINQKKIKLRSILLSDVFMFMKETEGK